jgi:hypothetical protein
MSGRRFGRVTVEGWVEEVAVVGMSVVDVYRERDWGASGSSEVRATFYQRPDDAARVEFLPEPVVFADGDALRFAGGTVWNRFHGHWSRAGSEHRYLSSDDVWAAHCLRDGVAVRLVPEGGK